MGFFDGSNSTTSTQTLDPSVRRLLFGDDGNGGITGTAVGIANQHFANPFSPLEKDAITGMVKYIQDPNGMLGYLPSSNQLASNLMGAGMSRNGSQPNYGPQGGSTAGDTRQYPGGNPQVMGGGNSQSSGGGGSAPQQGQGSPIYWDNPLLAGLIGGGNGSGVQYTPAKPFQMPQTDTSTLFDRPKPAPLSFTTTGNTTGQPTGTTGNPNGTRLDSTGQPIAGDHGDGSNGRNGSEPGGNNGTSGTTGGSLGLNGVRDSIGGLAASVNDAVGGNLSNIGRAATVAGMMGVPGIGMIGTIAGLLSKAATGYGVPDPTGAFDPGGYDSHGLLGDAKADSGYGQGDSPDAGEGRSGGDAGDGSDRGEGPGPGGHKGGDSGDSNDGSDGRGSDGGGDGGKGSDGGRSGGAKGGDGSDRARMMQGNWMPPQLAPGLLQPYPDQGQPVTTGGLLGGPGAQYGMTPQQYQEYLRSITRIPGRMTT